MRRFIAKDSNIAPATLALSAIALAGFVWAGCDSKSGGDEEKASAEQPSAGSDKQAEKKPGSASPSAGQKKKKPKKPSPGAMKKRKPSGGEITDEEVEKFVEVTETLRPKKKKFKKALDGAESKSEAKKAQMRIMKETRKAAEDAGLEFSRFQAIARQVKTNPKLQKRLREAGSSNGSDSADGG